PGPFGLTATATWKGTFIRALPAPSPRAETTAPPWKDKEDRYFDALRFQDAAATEWSQAWRAGLSTASKGKVKAYGEARAALESARSGSTAARARAARDAVVDSMDSTRKQAAVTPRTALTRAMDASHAAERDYITALAGL